MYKILIVEDDNTIAERLASHLKKWNYKTVCVRDFKNVMEEFKKTDPQLVILDIGLPFYNGFYWCQEIRKLSNVPIIFLSSMNDNMNIVMAINMGGDDFVIFAKLKSDEEAFSLKKQIKYNVRQFNIKSKEPFHLSFSIGIAKFNGKNTDAFLSAMDDSMYEAKNMHRLMQ